MNINNTEELIIQSRYPLTPVQVLGVRIRKFKFEKFIINASGMKKGREIGKKEAKMGSGWTLVGIDGGWWG